MNLPQDWHIVDDHHLEREYAFPDFKTALAFVNEIGAAAEAANHHPDIHLAWGKVRLTLWTHTANGVTEKDFALADKIERLWHHGPGLI
ncbi:MAG TPA: 4a-hydroxytetrahydrobiopterin dehydratase [Thermoanaerobaculia bacterium]|nr:4a-hydroxytetrahydrobiopterin dehydratase [Thermoanaerobaculia bacterium]